MATRCLYLLSGGQGGEGQGAGQAGQARAEQDWQFRQVVLQSVYTCMYPYQSVVNPLNPTKPYQYPKKDVFLKPCHNRIEGCTWEDQGC